ncbi:MAG: acyl-CoA dehydrogenase family protein [Deltaproteobacteria bacterium]|nr:acyl-CoA dehydrogenase family protein [Deltaproteobacteria bacterium]
MIDLILTEEQKMFRETVRKFGETEVKPIIEELEAEEEFPWPIIKKLGQIGVLGVTIPTEYGGIGGGTVDIVIVMEEGGRASIPIPLTHLGSCRDISQFGNEEQKRRYLPPLATGEMICAFAQTEPGAGSDAVAMKTLAVLEGDHYLLNGAKCFITNAEVAGLFVLVAKTSKEKGAAGISAFIIERNSPGLSIGKKENKMGLHLSPTCEVILENCKVPKGNLLIAEGDAFKKLMDSFNAERCGNAALCLGMAQSAFERALLYAQEREAFGQPIGRFQGIQWIIADMAVMLSAGRLLVYQAAYKMDRGLRAIKDVAMAKLFANEMSQKIINDAMQIHGGYGYMRDYQVERLYRDTRGLAFGGGTPQILRNRIAYEIFKGW